jgi:mRNA-degrading endonuclease RelE of RelBE toxin-antitoxin system
VAASVILAPQLFEAIAKLPAKDQARVVEFISTFQANPAHPSVSLERLSKARSAGVWSGRVGRGIRAILHKDGET